MRLARPWKVPTHMPRVLIGSMAEMRVSISFAALLVKVTAMRPAGLTWPVCMSHATRVVSTRVLPLPAPARISADWWGSVTASSCCSLRPERKSMVGGNVPADYRLQPNSKTEFRHRDHGETQRMKTAAFRVFLGELCV